jgi:hypothetical protein
VAQRERELAVIQAESARKARELNDRLAVIKVESERKEREFLDEFAKKQNYGEYTAREEKKINGERQIMTTFVNDDDLARDITLLHNKPRTLAKILSHLARAHRFLFRDEAKVDRGIILTEQLKGKLEKTGSHHAYSADELATWELPDNIHRVHGKWHGRLKDMISSVDENPHMSEEEKEDWHDKLDEMIGGSEGQSIYNPEAFYRRAQIPYDA